MTYGLRHFAAAAGLFMPLAAGLSAAQAQPADTATPTNVAGLSSYNFVPPLFNPATASPEALAAYGFPPRPDAATRPQAYALWLRATGPSIKRITPAF